MLDVGSLAADLARSLLVSGAMHRTITGVFESEDAAERATHVLKRSGFPSDEISVLASDDPFVDEEAERAEVDDPDGVVLVGVSAPEDLVDVAKQLLRCSGATSVQVS
jgi:hypothetical protein